MLAARDEATADALLARAVARARDQGLASLQLNVLNRDEQHARLVRVHPFELETDVLTMWRGLRGTEPEPDWPAGSHARRRSSPPTPQRCTRCSTRRIVAGTRATCRSRTTTGSAG